MSASACHTMPGPDDADPDTVRRMEERNELFRVAAVSALKHGRLIPEARAWAEAWARLPVLKRPLSDGTPRVRAHSTEGS
jgi:hypothetical protein